ncbi:type II toxin-antitoxin system TacA family antitoxin [Entomobacter blattae]|uniref:DUF1778 domain-containing protein n=1 Tax=Entomobacter blattae TaxID=2762277 RepID=A0A7H1NRP5_9PROT|nr:DUF1778 domain-containing protein [Entomobacter blattae]QNT78455.1 hypothetical protein JGUZn3_12290 [Entomobacter blattae]
MSANRSAINIKMLEETRQLIDAAAQITGKTRTEFITESSRRSAEDTLLEQTYIRVSPESYAHFLSVLDEPPSGEGYERLMKVKTPWEE